MYYIMIDEKSAGAADSLDEAREKAVKILAEEPLPCSCWISDADGNIVEDVEKFRSPDFIRNSGA